MNLNIPFHPRLFETLKNYSGKEFGATCAILAGGVLLTTGIARMSARPRHSKPGTFPFHSIENA